MSRTGMPEREPWQAAAWSFLLPGLGQLQTGAAAIGIAFLVGYGTLIGLAMREFVTTHGSTSRGLALGAVLLGVIAASVGDAFRRAREGNPPGFEAARRQAPDAWKAVFLNRVIAGAGQLYLREWLSGGLLLLGWLLTALSSGALGVIGPSAIGLFATMGALRSSRARATNAPAGAVRYLIAFAALAVLAILVPLYLRARYVRAFRIPSQSMSPTLRIGDAFYVDVRRRGVAAVGEVVAFRTSAPRRTEMVKRVLAVADDVVEFRSDSVLVNGALVWRSPGATPGEFPVAGPGHPFRVPGDAVFLVGDNLGNSNDSRFTGPVPLRDVIGRAYHVYWPPQRSGPIPPAPTGL